MRQMKFKMERPGQVEPGQEVEIRESRLPSSWYYVIEPAVAMSANYPTSERLISKSGIVSNVEETDRGYFVTVDFDE